MKRGPEKFQQAVVLHQKKKEKKSRWDESGERGKGIDEEGPVLLTFVILA